MLILYGFILPFRPSRLVPLYQSIWTDNGSPLLAISRQQYEKLIRYFSAQGGGNTDPETFVPEDMDPGNTDLENTDLENISIALAMRYGKPDIRGALEKLAADNARKILVFPLYAQYSATTTASIFDAVTKELHQWRWVPELRFINSYHDNDAYIQALADSLKEHWKTHIKGQKLLMSFHGIPRANHLKGDPYFCQSHKTARLLADKLGLNEDEWLLTFQSRFGKAEWLQPYTSQMLEQLAGEGTLSVDVICPGFSTDCLETLEEIAVENRDIFLQAGGRDYHYIPALNASDEHIKALARIIEMHIKGWGSPSSVEELNQREKLAKGLEANR
jgi:ferrochelatase